MDARLGVSSGGSSGKGGSVLWGVIVCGCQDAKRDVIKAEYSSRLERGISTAAYMNQGVMVLYILYRTWFAALVVVLCRIGFHGSSKNDVKGHAIVSFAPDPGTTVALECICTYRLAGTFIFFIHVSEKIAWAVEHSTIHSS